MLRFLHLGDRLNTRLPIPQLRERFRKRKKRLRKRLKAHLGNDTCSHCGATSEELANLFTKKSWKKTMTLDHIVPMVLGGHPYSLANLQFLCYKCHRMKSTEETPQIVAHGNA